nr:MULTISPECIES: Rap1a/Tai family immunity protein [unclassified Bombella]
MCVGHAAHAQRVSTVSGEELARSCDKQSRFAACSAYLAGITDGASWSQSFGLLLGSAPSPAFCIPAQVKGVQIRSLVVGWLAGHSTALGQPAGRGVFQALHDNYTCPSGVASLYAERRAQAQRISSLPGKGLVALCSHNAGLPACNGYLAGTMDSEIWSRNFSTIEGAHNPMAFCVPKEMRMSQLRALIVGWYAGHEDALNEPAGRGVYRALHDNYPCYAGTPSGDNR